MAASQMITPLLLAWNEGEDAALDRLIAIAYQQLRRLAHFYMRQQRPDHTLQTTALVNEAYLRLVDCQAVGWRDGPHFFAVTARIMRRVLVDYARSKNCQKRGGHAERIAVDHVSIGSQEPDRQLIDLDEALEDLKEIDPRKSLVVELRFFGGLSVEETAVALNISSETVLRDWKLAKAWLQQEMGKSPDEQMSRRGS